ncbi:MAG: hypothetical protein OXB98_06020 [Bryobacterales bacterium]|nr:hypothetical protein [Bryobacterales bacterium]
MFNKPSLSSTLHFVVEVALFLATVAAFGLIIFLAGNSSITEIP